MTWNRAKDALLCAACSMVIWVFGEMRSDFRRMVSAIEGLTLKMEDISIEQGNHSSDLKDHEARIRDLEKRARQG